MIETKNLDKKCINHTKGNLITIVGESVGRFRCGNSGCDIIYNDYLTQAEKSKSNNYKNDPSYM